MSSYKTEYSASIYLTFAGKPMVLQGRLSEKETIFEISLKDFSLGDLINGIIRMVKPGYTVNFDKPWSYLLDAKIGAFKLMLKVPKASGKSTEFGISLTPDLKISGLEIKTISVFARSIRDVNFNMTGVLNFLGITYKLDDLFGKDGVNLLDPQGMPKPEPKPSIFELNFLGAGQHLELVNAAKYNHVQEVVDELSKLMNPPPPGTVVPAFSQALKFNNNSQWLFAIDAKIMNTVAFKIVFNDPVLYGLYLSLSGDKAKVFAGLDFEILYKKITDDIGVYQIELKLPDSIRNLEFGAISVTLPIIGLWIYTNGNFKVDLGFPYNQDFSRSFTIQAFPFTGSGGFYFAVLNGSTSLTVPKTTLGTFDPVLEFGIGMNLGLGKTFNKGILSAGLTLVVYGIVEGTLGWFKPYDKALVDPKATDLYYKLQGTFGIVGHIFGSINFAIISASLDIIVYAQATVILIAAEPVLLSFEAGVSVQLTVKINLGFFSIRVHLSFTATVKEQFTIGSSTAAQWKPRLAPAPKLRTSALPALNWNNQVTLPAAVQLNVNFVPFFTISKPLAQQQVNGVMSLFLENNNDQLSNVYQIDAHAFEAGSSLKPFDKLCLGIISWAIQAASTQPGGDQEFAALLKTQVTATQLDHLMTSLNKSDGQTDDQNIFSYQQLGSFLSKLFVLNIIAPQQQEQKQQSELPLTVFPMLPDLSLTNSADNRIINFDSYHEVNNTYLKEVAALVSRFTDQQPDQNYVADNTKKLSLATLLFRDYFLLIAKSLVQSAQENMEVYTYSIKNAVNLGQLATKFKTTVSALVGDNKTQSDLLKTGSKVLITSHKFTFGDSETFLTLQHLHPYQTDGTAWALEFIRLNGDIRMFKTGENLFVKGSPYTLLAGDTWNTIRSNFNLNETELTAIIIANQDLQILEQYTQVTLPVFYFQVAAGSTFLSILTTFSLDLDTFATINAAEDILKTDADLFVTHVKQLDLASLLTAVYKGKAFNKAGGSASRFALHGLRLPKVLTDGNPGQAFDALYRLSGQQLDMPEIKDPANFSYAITLKKNLAGNAVIPLTFNGIVTEGDQPAVLNYKLLPAEISRIYAFQQASFNPEITSGPDSLQLYQDQTNVFAFSNPINWQAPDIVAGSSIWTFPSALTGAAIHLPEVSLKMAVQTRPDAARTVTPLDNDSYCYGTLLPVSIRKPDNADQTGLNKHLFEIFGTDAPGIALLTKLLRTANPASLLESITILYPSDPGNDEARELRSGDQSKLLYLLINTNLSTETNPDSGMLKGLKQNKISNTTPIDFVSRIWKSSLVRTGGYYLYYNLDGESLPDTLFDKDGNGELYLMINYKQSASHQVAPYMNMAAVFQRVNPSQSLLFGEWNADLVHATPEMRNEMLLKNQLVRNAVIKPGNIGFRLSRKSAEAKYRPGAADHYAYDLEMQYNLLNYRIKGNERGFKNLVSITPAGPSTPKENPELWQYSKAIPVCKVYDGDATSAYTALGETVTIQFNWQDNYGNILHNPVKDVQYKILYFDQLISFSSWPSLTTDYYFYKPDTALPDNNFDLTFTFIPGEKYSFTPGNRDEQTAVTDQAKKSLKRYVEIYDQLIQSDVTIDMAVSVDPGKVYPAAPQQAVLKQGICDFIKQAMTWIHAFIEHPDQHNQYRNPDPFRYSYVFSCQVPVRNTQDIFALNVVLRTSRAAGLIDPQFIFNDKGKPVYAPGVQEVITAIKPKSSGNTGTDGTPAGNALGLSNFASHFEEAFGTEGVKLAATYVDEKSSPTEQAEELWVVRVKALDSNQRGIAAAVDYSKACYYAPQPLANFLFSLPDVTVYGFDYYQGKTQGSTAVSFNEIDSESWAQHFLQVMETLLAPDMSLPINMLDHLNFVAEEKGILASFLSTKQTLADAIALQTISILEQPDQQPEGIAQATEKLRQQLLINLYNGYRINAVVQYPVDIKTNYPDNHQPVAPNYYGKPAVTTNTRDHAENYSFSTAKIPLKVVSKSNKTSYLTYTFESQTPALASSIDVPVKYHITHAEFNIEPLNAASDQLPADLKNYEVSQWLNFMIPFDVSYVKAAQTRIPIPLRQYPVLPVYGSQEFISNAESLLPGEQTIAQAKLSSFSFDYNLGSYVPQDQYNFEICFNASPEEQAMIHAAESITAKQKALFSEMARFEYVANPFMDYFKTRLPELNQDTSKATLEELTRMLKAFSEICDKVSESWLALYRKSLRSKLTLQPEVIKALFSTRERSSETGSLFEIVVTGWSVKAGQKQIDYVPFPVIDLEGWLPEIYRSNGTAIPLLSPGEFPSSDEQVIFRYYQQQDQQKKYLSFEAGCRLRSRVVTFHDLSVLLIQNAQAGLWIQRNADLSQVYPTAKAFIYATPLSRFNNPVMPALNISHPFLLQPPSANKRQLKDYLSNLLSGLLSIRGKEVAPANLKVLVQYQYTMSGKPGDMPVITLPVALMPPTLFTAEDISGTGPACTALNQIILDWFRSTEPVLNNGHLVLSATFYSSLTGTTNSLPLLLLQHLLIDVNKITDIKLKTASKKGGK